MTENYLGFSRGVKSFELSDDEELKKDSSAFEGTHTSGSNATRCVLC